MLRVKYEETYEDLELKTFTHYFRVSKEDLETVTKMTFPEAVEGTLSIELPDEYGATLRDAKCQISPVLEDKIAGKFESEWIDIKLPYEEIEAILKTIKN